MEFNLEVSIGWLKDYPFWEFLPPKLIHESVRIPPKNLNFIEVRQIEKLPNLYTFIYIKRSQIEKLRTYLYENIIKKYKTVDYIYLNNLFLLEDDTKVVSFYLPARSNQPKYIKNLAKYYKNANEEESINFRIISLTDSQLSGGEFSDRRYASNAYVGYTGRSDKERKQGTEIPLTVETNSIKVTEYFFVKKFHKKYVSSSYGSSSYYYILPENWFEDFKSEFLRLSRKYNIEKIYTSRPFYDNEILSIDTTPSKLKNLTFEEYINVEYYFEFTNEQGFQVIKKMRGVDKDFKPSCSEYSSGSYYDNYDDYSRGYDSRMDDVDFQSL